MLQASPRLAALLPIVCVAAAAHAERPAILLTGYWPPSNEAVRQFSPNPEQNPDGWAGANWEGRGYDVYAFFPEFDPPDCTSCGAGMGDFEVDYQDTSSDWWEIANAIEPVAIITFSRTNSTLSWELEMNQFNSTSWVNDYMAPTQPTPNPPDDSVPAETLRTSTLPVQEIVDAVNGADLGLNAFICFSNSAGSFLSGFIAYHGVWYQSMHENDPVPCVAAGHVHVGRLIPWETAEAAAEVTLRVVMDHVDTLLPAREDVDGSGTIDIGDLNAILATFGDLVEPGTGPDVDCSGVVDLADLNAVLASFGLPA